MTPPNSLLERGEEEDSSIRANADDRGCSEAAALLKLAERCEREQPSFELECAIAEAVGFYRPHPDFRRPRSETPTYTSSIDAAVTLVPRGVYLAELRHVSPTNVWCVLGLEIDAETEWSGQAKTEPMARCAAALRARAHEVAVDAMERGQTEPLQPEVSK